MAGRARAAQTNRSGPEPGRDTTLAVPVLIHGDASFAAQGVVAETFNLARLAGYIFVDVDNHCGDAEAIGYLIEQGHRRIATITGPLTWASAAARLEGYRRALHDAAIPAAPELTEIGDAWGLSTGEVAARHLVERGSSFTAIFAQSDLLALGAISGLRASGLRVPDDVSVIGYDNPGCALRRPAADHDPATDARGWWRGCGDRHRWNRATAIRRRSGAGPPAASGTFGRPWHGGAAEPDPSQKRGCSGIGCPVMVAASSRPWRRGSR